jgi:FkbM family methyltransferase
MRDGLAAFVYRKVLKPAPLRWLANQALLMALPRTVSLEEGVLTLNPADPVISGALAFGVYENFEMALFREVVGAGMRVFDIGANIGIYTVIAARRVGARGKVIACEPEPANFALLQQNVADNGFTNVVVNAVAVADRAGTMTLHLSRANKGHHSLVGGDGDDAGGTIDVEVATGDALIAAAGLNGVDVLKIDIEGAEPLALAGLKNALSASDLALFFELTPEPMARAGFGAAEMLRGLMAAGFRLYEIREGERALAPVGDAAAFVGKLAGDDYANLLCLKGNAGADAAKRHLAGAGRS